MSGAEFLNLASLAALGLLSAALLVGLVRIVVGPTLADRVVSLDLMVMVAVGYVAVVAVLTGHLLYLDIAVSLALVGFLAVLALARLLVGRRAGGSAPPRARGEIE